jgi:hypothetical protein
MKRLALPILLVIASLITAAIFTTITAVTFASYSEEDAKSNKTLVIDQSMTQPVAKQ